MQDISKDNISLKEDVKIYQRQLAMLRQSIIKYQTIIKNSEISGANSCPRVVLDLKSINQQDNKSEQAPLQPIVESMLQHEKETRIFMKEMLEDQRSIFLDELHHFMENVSTKQIHSDVGSGDQVNVLRDVSTATQKLAVETESQQKALRKALQDLKEREENFRETMAEEFRQRESALDERERQLHELLQNLQENNGPSNQTHAISVIKAIHSSRSVGINTDPLHIPPVAAVA